MADNSIAAHEKALDAMFFIASCARIAHHIPGRIRLKFTYESAKGLEMKQISLTPELIYEAPGIENIRVNRATGSVTIEYDSAVLPDTLWDKLVGGKLAEQEIREVKARLMELWQSKGGKIWNQKMW